MLANVCLEKARAQVPKTDDLTSPPKATKQVTVSGCRDQNFPSAVDFTLILSEFEAVSGCCWEWVWRYFREQQCEANCDKPWLWKNPSPVEQVWKWATGTHSKKKPLPGTPRRIRTPPNVHSELAKVNEIIMWHLSEGNYGMYWGDYTGDQTLLCKGRCHHWMHHSIGVVL